MFLTLFGISLCGGLFGGGTALLLFRFLVKVDLHTEKSPSILEGGGRIFKRKIEKRTPKALTDLMAYTKELQEEGENRG